MLEVLAPTRGDPYWHLRIEIDIRENILARPDQRAYIARYGRQDFWCQRSIVAIEQAVTALSKVVQKENDLTRVQEDR